MLVQQQASKDFVMKTTEG